MNRPLFRARNLDPSKRIRVLLDPHDNNNNDLTPTSTTQPPPSSSSSSSTTNLLVSLSSTSTNPASTESKFPQRCVPDMPFVSGMEREEETEYHLQNALDAQRRLGSAKIRAVPIPDLYEDPDSKTIYPDQIELPKQLIRLQPLQLESDDPEYDMDQTDLQWFRQTAHTLCPQLTHFEYETIIDKLENASTRTLISLDEARLLFASSTPSMTNDAHIKCVYEFWHDRRTTREKRLKLRVLTERDVKEEKGKHHPYVAFRRRVEKMTTRKNRKNDEQAYMSMLKLKASFEAVVKLTNLIKLRETTKASWLECVQSIFQTRCEAKADEEILPPPPSSTNHHSRSYLKTSSLMNSNTNLTSSQHQQLLAQLLRIENQKKNHTLASLLQTPIQSRSLSIDPHDSLQQKIKRFKSSHKKANQTDKLTQLLSSPTTPSTPHVHSLSIPPQSILERLSPSSAAYSPSQQAGRRRLKNSLSGTVKASKTQRNLSAADLWSLADSTPNGAVLLKAQLLEAARKLQQKEELENMNRRVLLQDGSAVLSQSNENLNNSRLEETNPEEEEAVDPWQFRPKHGCRYLRPIDDDQQRVPTHRSSFSSFYSLTSSERGHLGKRRLRVGRGGRLLYDRHLEQENTDEFDSSHFAEKPVLWHVASQPSLAEAYRHHSHFTVREHTEALAHHLQSKSSAVAGKSKPVDFHDHTRAKSCSANRVLEALDTLIEPQPPSPSTSPPLSTTNALSASQQMMLISTPPTPPPSAILNTNELDPSQSSAQQQASFYTKPSSGYVLSPSASFYPSQLSVPAPSSPSSCALVQFVQLHRILPSSKTHNFASTTPVTTSDS